MGVEPIEGGTMQEQTSRSGLLRREGSLQKETIRDFAARKLTSLCTSLGEAELLPQVLRAFEALAGPWAEWEPGTRAPWPTDITDDGSPFEFSVAFGSRGTQVRILSESQSLPLSETSTWKGGLALNQRILRDFGGHLSAFEKVVDLFAPTSGLPSRFSIWHAVMVAADTAPAFKVYLNPGLQGEERAAAVVDAALSRLDLPHARQFLTARGKSSRISYLSFDLVASADARVKVYVDHPGLEPSAVDAYVQGAANIERGQAAEWIERLTHGAAPNTERPFQTCFAFRAGRVQPDVTVSVPLRFYVSDDEDAVQRACDLLDATRAACLREAVQRVAERPLEMGRGLVTYVSLRREGAHVRQTVYLAPEMYSIAAPRPARALSAPRRSPSRDVGAREAAPRDAGARASVVRQLREPAEDTRAVTFLDIRTEIARWRAGLAEHEFLRRLRASSSLDIVRAIAPRVGFFVLSFQDVQRLVHEYTADPELAEIARVHRLEDQGHDLWYLEDLERLGTRVDVPLLFSAEHERMRGLTYRTIADVIHARDDRTRLALVLALESAGQLFFGGVIELLARLGNPDALRYFGRPHAEAEGSHEVFGTEGAQALERIVVPASVLPEVLAVIGRVFETIRRLGDDLVGYLDRVANRESAHTD
jgi:DMATS type aromatic prenyltransferase